MGGEGNAFACPVHAAACFPGVRASLPIIHRGALCRRESLSTTDARGTDKGRRMRRPCRYAPGRSPALMTGSAGQHGVRSSPALPGGMARSGSNVHNSLTSTGDISGAMRDAASLLLVYQDPVAGDDPAGDKGAQPRSQTGIPARYGGHVGACSAEINTSPTRRLCSSNTVTL